MRKTIGRIAGPLGILFIVFAVLARLIITGEFNALIWTQLALGLGGVLIFATTAFDDLRGIATGRGAVFVLSSAVSTVALVGVLGGLNYWVAQKRVVWDLSEGKIHTLAEQSQSLLAQLSEENKVTVTAFFRPVDPEYALLEALLRRYQQIGGKFFDYQFVDGVKNPQLARELGVNQNSARIIFETAEGREVRVKEISEESFTNALAELAQGAVRKLYFLTGHGEKPIGAGSEGGGGLKLWVDGLRAEGYIPEELNLLARKDVPSDALGVVVVGPTSPLLPGEVEALERFASTGGRLVFMLDPGYESGLEGLLGGWGVELLQGVVVDPSSQEPLWALAQEFSDHPIATPRRSPFGTMAFIFPDARGLRTRNVEGYESKELFKTSREAWGENDPFDMGASVSRGENDDHGPLTLAVAITRKGSVESKGATPNGDAQEDSAQKPGPKADGMRVVVFGDSEFASNGFIRQGGNRDLVLNTVQWLAGQDSKITIRPKTREMSTMSVLSKKQRTALSFISLNLLPLTLIGLGLSVWSLRKAK